MNLNPLYHWRRYKELSLEAARIRSRDNFVEKINEQLIKRNEELVLEKLELVKQIDTLQAQLNEITQGSAIIARHSHKPSKCKRGKRTNQYPKGLKVLP